MKINKILLLLAVSITAATSNIEVKADHGGAIAGGIIGGALLGGAIASSRNAYYYDSYPYDYGYYRPYYGVYYEENKFIKKNSCSNKLAFCLIFNL